MDPKRVNEFGTSGEDNSPGTPEGGQGAIANGPNQSRSDGSKPKMNKKND